jgi:hypothetical protein
MWIGSQHPEPPYILLGQFCTAFYFSYFLILIPLIGLIENTLSDLGTIHTSKNSPQVLSPMSLLSFQRRSFSTEAYSESINSYVDSIFKTISPWWTGRFAEAEGCFKICISPRKDKEGLPTGQYRVLSTLGILLSLEFQHLGYLSYELFLNSKDEILVKLIHKFFNCGCIRYEKEGKFVVYHVRSVDHLN